MFHPKSGQNVLHEYLGVIYGRRAHQFNEYNWCSFILETFRRVEPAKKGYIEADLCLLMLFFLDMVGLKGDSVPKIRPSVMNWTQKAVNNHTAQLERIGGLDKGVVIQWQPESEQNLILAPRIVNADIRQYLPQRDTSVKATKRSLGEEGQSALTIKKQRKSRKEGEKKQNKQEARGAERDAEEVYASAMPLTRLDIDHMSLLEVKERREWLDTHPFPQECPSHTVGPETAMR